MIKVKAKQLGYYNLKRQKEGTVFSISSEKEFSEVWMEKLGEQKEELPKAAKASESKFKSKDASSSSSVI